MTKLPRLRGRQVINALRKAGFDVDRIRGSHHLLKHADGRSSVVPVHSGETIGLLNKILSDGELTREEFQSLL